MWNSFIPISAAAGLRNNSSETSLQYQVITISLIDVSGAAVAAGLRPPRRTSFFVLLAAADGISRNTRKIRNNCTKGNSISRQKEMMALLLFSGQA
jgi:hypothetical protein